MAPPPPPSNPLLVPPVLQNGNLPPDLINRVFKGVPVPTITTAASVASYVSRSGVTVTWYGFRFKPCERLAQYYACVLSAGNPNGPHLGAPIDLYDIGAVGSNFDVDILLTDTNRRSLATGLFCRVGNDPVKAAKIETNKKYRGFYFAPRAFFDSSLAKPRCMNQVTLDMAQSAAGVVDCVLWVISYRSGSRKQPPFTLPPKGNHGPGHHEDSDGSPCEGMPGGEEH